MKRLLILTGVTASLFLSEFQAEGTDILCPIHGKVTYNGVGPARCPECYPAKKFDYWCPKCFKWHDAPSHLFHTDIPVIPQFIEKFFHNGYGNANNSETARLGDANQWALILSDWLRKEITNLPRAQAVLEMFSWSLFYMQEKGVFFNTNNSCYICWNLYSTLLNSENRPLFSVSSNMAHFRAPDKLLEDVAKMGPQFEKMCKSFGWIRTNDNASSIKKSLDEHFRELGFYFDSYTKQLKQNTPIQHCFNFFHSFEDGGNEFWDRNIENNNLPIMGSPKLPSSPTLGNVLLEELASNINNKMAADPINRRFTVSENCYIDVEDSSFLYLSQLMSDETDLKQKFDTTEILLKHLTEGTEKGDLFIRIKPILEKLQINLQRRILEGESKNLQIWRGHFIEQIREQIPEDMPLSHIIRIAITKDTKIKIPDNYLGQEADGYIRTIPLHEMLKQDPKLEHETINSLMGVSEFDPCVPLRLFPNITKSISQLFDDSGLIPSPAIFSEEKISQQLDLTPSAFINDTEVMGKVKASLDRQQEDINTSLSLYDLSAQAIPKNIPLKNFAAYNDTLENLFYKLELPINEDLPQHIRLTSLTEIKDPVLLKKPLEFFLKDEEVSRRDEEQSQALCKLMDERFKDVNDFQIFASALTLYAHYELGMKYCDIPFFLPYFLPREVAFNRFSKLIQTLRVDRDVVNVCHNLGKVKGQGFSIVLEHFLELLKSKNIKVEEDKYKLLHLGSFNEKKKTIYFPLGVCQNSQTNPFILALCADIRTQVTDLFTASYVYYLLAQKGVFLVMKSRSVEALKAEYESMIAEAFPNEKISLNATIEAINRSWINIFDKEKHLFAKDDVIKGKWEIESEEIYRVFLEQLEECGCEIDKNDISKIKQKPRQLRVQQQVFSISEDDSSEFKGGTSLSIEKF